MHQITINVNQSIYEHIMFFLKNLPKNLIDIQSESRVKKLTVNTAQPKSKIKLGLAKGKTTFYGDIMAEDKDINDMFYGA